jgi:hypothetical protein
MELSNLLNVLYDTFGSAIEPDEETKRKKSLLKLQGVLSWFLSDDELLVLDGKEDFAGKVWRGTETLPKDEARAIMAKLDKEAFSDFVDEFDPMDDVLDLLFEGFIPYGYVLKKDDYTTVIPDILEEILNSIIRAPRKTSIRYCEIHDGYVYIGTNKIKLPDALDVPGIVDDNEQTYVNALLEVYKQHSGHTITSIEDLENETPIYKSHIEIQRKYFYSAESVLHQIRDAGIFTDGENEFQILLNEAYEGVNDSVILQYKNGFERVNAVIQIVASINLNKSYLSRESNGLVGVSEKKGLIHMLVNDGRIKWIYSYDTAI